MVRVSTRKLAAFAVIACLALFVPFSGAAAGGDDGLGVEWLGFISCGVSTIGVTLYPCASLDPNHNLDHATQAGSGLRTIIAVLTWDTDLLGAEELKLTVSHDAGQTDATGPSPVTVRIDDAGWDPANAQEIRFRVNVAVNSGLTYQQPFAVAYSFHHGTPAP